MPQFVPQPQQQHGRQGDGKVPHKLHQQPEHDDASGGPVLGGTALHAADGRRGDAAHSGFTFACPLATTHRPGATDR